MRKPATDLGGGLDEGDGVIVVLLDPGRNGEHVRIKDDVFGREADLPGQQGVGTRADLDLALHGVGLAFLVEGHHHDRGAVAAHQPRLAQELFLALLHRDGIDDALALQAFQSGLDHAPLGAVDHHRDPGDVRLGGNQVQVGHHRLLGVQQTFVHVDVQHLGAVLDLLTRDHYRLVVAVVLDQLLELRAAGDVGALADVDEVGLRCDHQWLEAAEAGVAGQGAHGLGLTPRWRRVAAAGVARRSPPRRSRRCARAWCHNSRR